MFDLLRAKIRSNPIIFLLLQGACYGGAHQFYRIVFHAHYHPSEFPYIMRMIGRALVGALLFWITYLGTYRRFCRNAESARIVQGAAAIDLWSYSFLLIEIPKYWLETASYFLVGIAWLGCITFKTLAWFRLAALWRSESIMRGALVMSYSFFLGALLLETGARSYLNLTQQTVEAITELQRNTGPGHELLLGQLFRRVEERNIIYLGEPHTVGRINGAPVSLNSLGFRGPEYLPEKPAGVFRILGLGDSFTFALGVPVEKGFLQQLEGQLNAGQPQRQYETLNFGLPGWNTIQEVEALKTIGLEYHPDLILVQFYFNDLSPPFFLPRRVDYFQQSNSVVLDMLKKSPLLVRVQETVQDNVNKSVEKRGLQINWMHAKLTVPDDFANVPEEYRYMAGWENFAAAFERLRELTQPAGIPVAVFVIHDAGKPFPFDGRVQELARKNSFQYCDVWRELNATVAASGRDPYSYWLSREDFHYTEETNALVAGIMYRQLKAWGY